MVKSISFALDALSHSNPQASSLHISGPNSVFPWAVWSACSVEIFTDHVTEAPPLTYLDLPLALIGVCLHLCKYVCISLIHPAWGLRFARPFLCLLLECLAEGPKLVVQWGELYLLAERKRGSKEGGMEGGKKEERTPLVKSVFLKNLAQPQGWTWACLK